jgi:hypothetical protein
MAWGYVAVGAGTLIGGALASNASKKAADTQAGAAQYAADLQHQQWQTSNDQQQPWIQSGGNAINQMGQMTSPGGSMTHVFNNQDLNSNLAPNYQFGLEQGMGQTQNYANATGGLVSGNAMQGLNKFSQDYAGNAYQNAFNNYQASQTNIFNRLASVAGVGQTATSNNQVAGVNSANNMGNFSTSAAAAQAAGTVGQANAINSGISNLSSLAYLNKGSNLPPAQVQAGGTTGADQMTSPGSQQTSMLNSQW